MKIEQLLEKHDHLQLKIILELFLHREGVQTQYLMDMTGLSRPSLEAYLDEFEVSEKSLKMRVRRRENLLWLELHDSQSLQKLTGSFLRQSVKYQLLLILIEDKKYSTIKLTEILNVSESTLFRKIKELNQLLQEFDIRIKNNQLCGDELQIRYLYFNIFDFLVLEFRPDFLVSDEQDSKIIDGLEQGLRLTFSENSKRKIGSWLKISRKRKGSFSPSARLIQHKFDFQNDRLYQLLDAALFQQALIRVTEDNFETIQFYIFLISYYLLDIENSYRFDIQRNRAYPLSHLNSLVRERLLNRYQSKRIALEDEKELGYLISNVNNRLYFFTGTITNELKMYRNEQESNDLIPSLLAFLEELELSLDEQFSAQFHENKFSKEDFSDSYLNILIYLERLFKSKITVVYDFSNQMEKQYLMIESLKAKLKGIENINLEAYMAKHHFDLLITDSKDCSAENSYFVSDYVSDFDIERIVKRIIELKR